MFDQELLEYMAQDGVVRQGVLDNLPPEAAEWAEERLQMLLREQNLSQHPAILNLARVVLALGRRAKRCWSAAAPASSCRGPRRCTSAWWRRWTSASPT